MEKRPRGGALHFHERISACGPAQNRRPRLRHRASDLARHLVLPNLQGHRAQRGSGGKTRLLQILHSSSLTPRLFRLQDNLRPVERHVKSRTKVVARGRCFSRKLLIHNVLAATKKSLPICRYPPQIRRFPAGIPQSFAQRIASKSAGFPSFFLRNCTGSSTPFRCRFFRSVCAAIPEELAGSADKKMGVKRAVDENCGKVGGRRAAVRHRPLFLRAAQRGGHSACL